MRRALIPCLAVTGLVACARNPGPSEGVGATETVEVKVVAFNDFHGNLGVPKPWKTKDGEVPSGGVDYFAAHVAKLRAQNPNNVVVSAGDLIGASPLTSSLFHDEPTIEAMNMIGLDINGVGNHEFDEGPKELVRMKAGGCHPEDGCKTGHEFEGARFAFLAANVVDDHTKEHFFPPYEIKERAGIPIAFIGMTLENTPAYVPPVVKGLQFLDEADTVNHLVGKLRDQGVEAIVVVVHEGGFIPGDYDECGGISGPIVDIVKRLDPEVDLVVSGHTHQAYNCEIDGRRVTSAGCYGRLITDIDLTLDPKTRDVVKVSAKNLLVTHDVEPTADLSGLEQHYAEAAAPLANRPIGQLSAPIGKDENEHGESPLGSVIADAQLEATQAADKGAADLAFMNTGGIRTGLDKVGPVTYEDLFAVHPFGNSLVTVTLTGAQLHQALEEQWGEDRVRFLQPSSSLRYVYHDEAVGGVHVPVETVTIGGKPLDLKKGYRVTLNNYLAERGIFKLGTDPLPGVLDLDALEAYVEAHSPLAPPVPGRLMRK
ncbi:MAG: bifunctional metallophosphatase/5'-nucleotidase [Deltaproteobacteria bacterium]|nr:bifunctional metallophosphatase/5'-nucleotidase [Deltaproteobacteria bacterium]